MIIRSDCSFCDQNLQSVAILHKVRNFHLHFFFNSNSYFLQNNSIVIFHSVVAF